jgi:hypothetical protein
VVYGLIETWVMVLKRIGLPTLGLRTSLAMHSQIDTIIRPMPAVPWICTASLFIWSLHVDQETFAFATEEQ